MIFKICIQNYYPAFTTQQLKSYCSTCSDTFCAGLLNDGEINLLILWDYFWFWIFVLFFLLSVLLKCCHQPCLWAEPWKEEMNQIIKKMEMFPLLHSFVFDFFFFFNTPQMFSGTLLNVGRRQSRYFPETKESKVVT